MIYFWKKFKIILIIIVVWGGVFSLINFSQAKIDISPSLATTFGLGTKGFKQILIDIVNAFLGLVGVVALSVILYGGFLWMTSGGNPQKIEKARSVIISGIIGLAVILSSLAIVWFVFRGTTGGGGSAGGGAGGNSSGNGALGGGALQSVYPAPGQRNVARNTNIAVTFKEEIDPNSIRDAAGNILLDASGVPVVKIAKQKDILTGPYIQASVTVSAGNRTFVFNPVDLLGNASENEWYTVELTNNILKADGTPVFGGLGGFDWSFEVGTFADNTPPYIVSVFPVSGGTYAKNAVIQIRFSEAVDPSAINNTTIVISDSGGSVSGNLKISNQYRTVEFLGASCGVNSCNETVYCLPGGETITTTVFAADLGSEPPLALGPPFNGVVDMAGNSLDGNHNNIAEGPGTDNYVWSFNTNNDMELTAPTISNIDPALGEQGVPLYDPIEILFSELIMSSSLNNNNLKIINPVTDYWVTAENIPSALPVQTQAYIYHNKFKTATDYKLEATSQIKDIYQNCLFPSIGPGCIAPAPAGQNCCCQGAWASCPCP